MELDAISQPELEQIERIGSVDLVIGILDVERQEKGSNVVAMTREALTELSKPLRAIVVCNNGTHSTAAATPEFFSAPWPVGKAGWVDAPILLFQSELTADR